MKNVTEAVRQSCPISGTGPRRLKTMFPAVPLLQRTDAGKSENDEDIRLRIALKRAVEGEAAPRSLIEAIRERIRDSK